MKQTTTKQLGAFYALSIKNGSKPSHAEFDAFRRLPRETAAEIIGRLMGSKGVV